VKIAKIPRLSVRDASILRLRSMPPAVEGSRVMIMVIIIFDNDFALAPRKKYRFGNNLTNYVRVLPRVIKHCFLPAGRS
jgi:hypothetical protein